MFYSYFTALYAMPARTSYTRKVYVCLSVRLCVICVTKRKKVVPTFLYHMKDRLALFCEKNGWWGRPLLLEM